MNGKAGEGSQWNGIITRDGKEQSFIVESLMISEAGKITGHGTDQPTLDFTIEGTCLLEPEIEPNVTFTQTYTEGKKVYYSGVMTA